MRPTSISGPPSVPAPPLARRGFAHPPSWRSRGPSAGTDRRIASYPAPAPEISTDCRGLCGLVGGSAGGAAAMIRLTAPRAVHYRGGGYRILAADMARRGLAAPKPSSRAFGYTETLVTASLPLRHAAGRPRPDFFRFSFFVPRERGGAADFSLRFGRTELQKDTMAKAQKITEPIGRSWPRRGCRQGAQVHGLQPGVQHPCLQGLG
jgi:hypothetical protein